MLLERVERVAVAAFQADLIRGVAEIVGVEERVVAWEQWLEHDPTVTKEARTEVRMRELLEAV